MKMSSKLKMYSIEVWNTPYQTVRGKLLTEELKLLLLNKLKRYEKRFITKHTAVSCKYENYISKQK